MHSEPTYHWSADRPAKRLGEDYTAPAIQYIRAFREGALNLPCVYHHERPNSVLAAARCGSQVLNNFLSNPDGARRALDAQVNFLQATLLCISYLENRVTYYLSGLQGNEVFVSD